MAQERDEIDTSKFSPEALTIITMPLSARQDPTQILPFLFLGDATDARNKSRLEQLGITNIVNCCADPQRRHPDEAVKNDLSGLTLSILAYDIITFSMSQFFDKTTEFIRSVRDRGERLLVHCQAGVSRSPTIVCAFLIQEMGLTADEALFAVRHRRGCVEPNPGFVAQLQRLHKKIEKLEK